MIGGAQQLTWRIECQTHWARAPAVQAGKQARHDPDEQQLVELREDVRLYRPQTFEERVSGGSRLVARRMTKRVVDGWWTTQWVDVDPTARMTAPLSF
jgi:hypothetical protein